MLNSGFSAKQSVPVRERAEAITAGTYRLPCRRGGTINNPQPRLPCVNVWPSVATRSPGASWTTGRGTGASIRRYVTIPPFRPASLSGKRIAAVSGTNGKTTTITHIAALRASVADARDVVSNPTERTCAKAQGVQRCRRVRQGKP